MKPRPDLNTLSKEVYQANKEKGFHDKEQSNEAYLMLVITELSEAVESDRKGKRANFVEYENRKLVWHNELSNIIPDCFNYAFEWAIKDSIEDELADAVIRLLDLAGLRGYKLCTEDATIVEFVHCSPIDEKFESFIEHVFAVVKLISGNYDMDFSPDEIVELTILSIEYLCDTLSIDLWSHVELKLKYNQSRPYKHGKAY
ncbi:hypothetical protein CLV62_12533 [Dysgonomonas alginatilytica]|uniref:Uncharacterized protein n=1 Tax=Dysgonomonas alginatilytica TaxID=1605892 RepID=A0A2V3PMS7_9BACT|nr:hypothetical protein [Dysgonomonas alginatilytica]PXV61200.1 hypothetical protein CLV62_12533 [Dysgonomonas alginatilytica]